MACDGNCAKCPVQCGASKILEKINSNPEEVKPGHTLGHTAQGKKITLKLCNFRGKLVCGAGLEPAQHAQKPK